MVVTKYLLYLAAIFRSMVIYISIRAVSPTLHRWKFGMYRNWSPTSSFYLVQTTLRKKIKKQEKTVRDSKIQPCPFYLESKKLSGKRSDRRSRLKRSGALVVVSSQCLLCILCWWSVQAYLPISSTSVVAYIRKNNNRTSQARRFSSSHTYMKVIDFFVYISTTFEIGRFEIISTNSPKSYYVSKNSSSIKF